MPIMNGNILIDSGGMLRCCIKTVEDFIKNHEGREFPNGMTLDCDYEREGNKNIVLEGSCFKWNSKSEK